MCGGGVTEGGKRTTINTEIPHMCGFHIWVVVVCGTDPPLIQGHAYTFYIYLGF